MTNQLTQEQINWAKSHDWYCGMCADCICVTDNFTLHGRHFSNTIVWTKSFKELRDWAGY